MVQVTNYQDFVRLFALAERIAIQAHEKPKYGNIPYVTHLRHVLDVLRQFGYAIDKAEDFTVGTAEILIAAWLHDVIEDTVLERAHLEFHFGARIAELAWRVADEPGESRALKNAATLPKIRADKSAVLIKLADRLANAEVALRLKIQGQPKLWNKYVQEYALFKSGLFELGEADSMWTKLDSLLIPKTK